MTPSSGYGLLLYAAIAIIALIVLIARYKINPFIVITPGFHRAGPDGGHACRQCDGGL